MKLMHAVPTIAIIGGGPSGLATAKAALECSLVPTIFEKTSSIGGIWQPQTGATWTNMRTNITRHTCMFSDFPWKRPVDEFPNQRDVFGYLLDYARHFQLERYFRLNASVRRLSPFGDKWNVELDENESQIFDFVIVCSGIFSVPNTIDGIEQFRGHVINANQCKDPRAFKDKIVVVIGNSFTGCEIAAEIAPIAKRLVHVAPRSFWILPRYLPRPSGHKVPLDLLFYSRGANARSKQLTTEADNVRKSSWLNSICKQGDVCGELTVETDPKDPQYVVISDSYIEQVREGRIVLSKSKIERFNGEKTTFSNGKSEHIDVIINCTGYKASLPFFGKETLTKLAFEPDDQLQPLLLHNTVFPNSIHGLAFVGMYRGPFFGSIELQARWATMVFGGKVKPPTEDEIERGIAEERRIRETRPRPQFPHGDYVALCEDIASQIGIRPDFDAIREEDPALYAKLWDGPFTTASYRLTGFGSNRELALQIVDEINAAMPKE